MEIIKFDTLGLDPKILRAITEMGFEEPSPIQAKAIPEVMAGHDVIGQAQTGTGKTAAFGIPLLQKIDPKNRKLQAIILCPTRELAIQVADEIRRLSKFMHGIKILPVYGGQDIGKQIRSLKGGVQLVIGTPGRVMDHLRRRTLRFDNLHTIVLDEADEMLNMGFREDIETILKGLFMPAICFGKSRNRRGKEHGIESSVPLLRIIVKSKKCPFTQNQNCNEVNNGHKAHKYVSQIPCKIKAVNSSVQNRSKAGNSECEQSLFALWENETEIAFRIKIVANKA